MELLNLMKVRRIILSQRVLQATYVAPNSCASKNDSYAGDGLRVSLHMQKNGVASISTGACDEGWEERG